jgi:hypothetical protein
VDTALTHLLCLDVHEEVQVCRPAQCHYYDVVIMSVQSTVVNVHYSGLSVSQFRQSIP